MLYKVEALEEIGRFASLRHKAPLFGQLSLIFARNGYGKSTICSVIRSAAEQDVKLISARRRLGAKKASSVQTLWKTGGVTFQAGTWNICPGPVHIFDQEYIRRNLHVAESVTINNKRSLVNVILGDEGVRLARKVSELDNQQREITTTLTGLEKTIKTAHVAITAVAPFANTDVPSDIDTQIEASQKRVELAKQSLAVKQKPDLRIFDFRELTSVEELAALTLASVNDRVGARITAHLMSHKMNERGSSWLRYGVEHMQGDNCPFCLQNTFNVDIVNAFKNYFGAEYAKLVDEIDACCKDFIELAGEDGCVFDAMLSSIMSDLDFWRNFCDLPPQPNI